MCVHTSGTSECYPVESNDVNANPVQLDSAYIHYNFDILFLCHFVFNYFVLLSMRSVAIVINVKCDNYGFNSCLHWIADQFDHTLRLVVVKYKYIFDT